MREKIKSLTMARVGLSTVGTALSTAEILQLRLAHAQARDAVLRPWDGALTARELRRTGVSVIEIATNCASRSEYLVRPDLGRQLAPESQRILAQEARGVDVVFIISDGLSSLAIDRHLLGLWPHLQRMSEALRLSFQIVVAPFARVAVSGEIGKCLSARVAVMVVGERPGMSAADSVGIYMTYDPAPGQTDADRNCISSIREPDGLSYKSATQTLTYLIESCMRLKLSGVRLKDGSDVAALK